MPGDQERFKDLPRMHEGRDLDNGEEGTSERKRRQEEGEGCWSSEMEELFREALEHVERGGISRLVREDRRTEYQSKQEGS
eukprot:765728-Hanusia_phi.AAC.3